MTSNYYPLSQHLNRLAETGSAKTTLTFREIETILSRKLPPTARKNATWWSNSRTEKYRQCAAWLDYGWEKTEVDVKQELVEFQYRSSD